MNRFFSEDVENVNANLDSVYTLIEHHLKDLKIWVITKNKIINFLINLLLLLKK